MKNLIRQQITVHRQTVDAVLAWLTDEIEAACRLTIQALERGNKLLLFGNGGSAADAQHVAAEFTGRFKLKRRALPAIALTTDASALTAIGNDFGFEHVFARQVEALACRGDLLIAFSTSGMSPNVIQGVERGRTMGLRAVGFTGSGGGELKSLCDVPLVVPSDEASQVQEMHIMVAHTICYVTELALYGSAQQRADLAGVSPLVTGRAA